MQSLDTARSHLPSLLIVDDEPAMLGALRDTLEREGFAVTGFTNPLKALDVLSTQSFAVIISDQRMPEMTGLDFLAECKRVQPHASRILITAVLSLPTVVEAINRGEIFRFIAKPWLREELTATVRNAVNRYELIVSNETLSVDRSRLNDELTNTNAILASRVKELEIHRTKLAEANRELATSFEHSLELCSRILSTYDPHLGGQTRAMVEIARKMAAEGDHLSESEGRLLVTAAWLCDLGLIGVHRELLRSFRAHPDRLTERELNTLHAHPAYSQTLASFLDSRPGLGEVIRAHHERFDGKGYPDGLSGLNIPWPARCLAVAVWFVECGTGRDAAIESVLAQSGKALDPEAVRLFLKVTHLLNLPKQVHEVLLDELKPGMVLASGLYSPHGLLLVGEGQSLNAGTITKIRNHNLAAPISQRLLIYS